FAPVATLPPEATLSESPLATEPAPDKVITPPLLTELALWIVRALAQVKLPLSCKLPGLSKLIWFAPAAKVPPLFTVTGPLNAVKLERLTVVPEFTVKALR